MSDDTEVRGAMDVAYRTAAEYAGQRRDLALPAGLQPVAPGSLNGSPA